MSETPLLQHQGEKEEAPRDDRLSTAGPCQATQVLEAAVNKWDLVAERLLDLAAGFWTSLPVHVGDRTESVGAAHFQTGYHLGAPKGSIVVNLLLVWLAAFPLSSPHL